MDERKKQVLRAVINDYVATAEPVGSRTIANKYNLGVSPATIRNEMSDLEELGYIKQPHTSAGRIPSDKGYRYYVDNLIETETVSKAEDDLISQLFIHSGSQMDAFFQYACRVLSKLTNHAAIMVKPHITTAPLKKISLMPLEPKRYLLIMITEDDAVYHRPLELDEPLQKKDLQYMEAILQSTLAGQNMEHFNFTALKEIANNMLFYKGLFLEAMELIGSVKGKQDDSQVLVNGTLNILNQPEFKDLEKVRYVLEVLETDNFLRQLLLPKASPGTMVYIGEELTNESMNCCSIISASYSINGQTVGSIGVLGPTRMDYPRIIGLVERISKEMSGLLSHY